MDKIKLSQKEFDDVYQIEDLEEITEETVKQPDKDTTPFLTEEEEEQDAKLFDGVDMEDTQP